MLASETSPMCNPDTDSTCTIPARANAWRSGSAMRSSSPSTSAATTAARGAGTPRSMARARRSRQRSSHIVMPRVGRGRRASRLGSQTEAVA
jgi:hypothetical protein